MHVFQALADPTRRAIVSMLVAGERSAGDIGAAFQITAPAVSQHLRALREARLVRVRVEAQRRIYRLNPEGLDEVKRFLFSVNRTQGGRAERPEQGPLTMADLVQARRLGMHAA